MRSRANAVLFPFCDSVRRGQPSFALDAQSKKLLRKPHRLSLHATAADRVIIESYIGRKTTPRGTLLVRVKDAEVIEVRAYLPTLN